MSQGPMSNGIITNPVDMIKQSNIQGRGLVGGEDTLISVKTNSYAAVSWNIIWGLRNMCEI